jgi:hypothetical protein
MGLIILIPTLFIIAIDVAKFYGATNIEALTLGVETAGLAALIETLFALRRQSKKPNLRLWIGDKDFRDDEIPVGTVFEGGHVSSNPSLDENKKEKLFHFYFDLYLENVGNEIAEFIQVQIRQENISEKIQKGIYAKQWSNHPYPRMSGVISANKEKWITNSHNYKVFQGGEDFIVYAQIPEKREIIIGSNPKISHQNLIRIGTIEYVVPWTNYHAEEEYRATLEITVQARNSTMKVSSIHLIPKEPQPEKPFSFRKE